MSIQTPANMTKDTLDRVMDLIKINIDSSRGWNEAAEHVDAPALAAEFKRIGGVRASYAERLRSIAKLNDEDPPESGSLKAMAHRWWLNVRDMMSDGPHAMLAEAERGEDEIKELYEKVLVETAGSPINALLHEQLTEIKATHDVIRDLRDATAD